MTNLNTLLPQLVAIILTSKVWTFEQWIKYLQYFKKLPVVKDSLLKLFSAHTFGAMSLFLVCVVTSTVRHIGDFRTQALNGIEIVGAGVKSGGLASAE